MQCNLLDCGKCFAGRDFKSIYCMGSEFTDIPQLCTNGYGRAEALFLQNNRIASLNNEDLVDFPNLAYVNVEDQKDGLCTRVNVDIAGVEVVGGCKLDLSYETKMENDANETDFIQIDYRIPIKLPNNQNDTLTGKIVIPISTGSLLACCLGYIYYFCRKLKSGEVNESQMELGTLGRGGEVTEEEDDEEDEEDEEEEATNSTWSGENEAGTSGANPKVKDGEESEEEEVYSRTSLDRDAKNKQLNYKL